MTTEATAWRRQHDLNQRLPTELLRFVKSAYGVEILHQAWRDFMVGKEKEFDPDSRHLPIFMPWFYYEWRPGLPGETRDEVADLPVAVGYLNRRGRYLESLTVRSVEAARRGVMSFFEVLDVEPGESLVLRDVLIGEEVVVIENTASETARRGDIFLARVVRLDGLAVLDGCAPIAFPPLEKSQIIDLRNQILRRHKGITPEMLREHCLKILEIYHSTSERLLNPKMPKLANTDGEPLAFCRVTERPDIQVSLRDQLTEYYRRWLDIGVPALGGQTPRQAIKTRDGREMVEALLLDLERREGPGRQGVVNREIATELRTTLGLR